jgi:hypothetical protein
MSCAVRPGASRVRSRMTPPAPACLMLTRDWRWRLGCMCTLLRIIEHPTNLNGTTHWSSTSCTRCNAALWWPHSFILILSCGLGGKRAVFPAA